MRALIYAILLTMLAQPVWAGTVNELLKPCTNWQATGYISTDFEVTLDGLHALTCHNYMNAMSDIGMQHCAWTGEVGSLKGWQASPSQLAQFFLNKAAEMPESWEKQVYGFLVMNLASKAFPCKK